MPGFQTNFNFDSYAYRLVISIEHKALPAIYEYGKRIYDAS